MRDLRVIADTGAILGLIYKRDQWHEWAVDHTKTLLPPFLTCEAVIAETCFLLRHHIQGQLKLLDLIASDNLQIAFSLDKEMSSIRSLMSKYSDLPISLADACLVRMSETIDDAVIFTVDSDFLIYRRHGRKKIPLISPF